jgi:hypothetical protein
LGNEVCPALFCDINDLSILGFERSFAEHRPYCAGFSLRNVELPVPPTPKRRLRNEHRMLGGSNRAGRNLSRACD